MQDSSISTVFNLIIHLFFFRFPMLSLIITIFYDFNSYLMTTSLNGYTTINTLNLFNIGGKRE
ncbi:hypothetical protein CN918_29790 [Priestia megaterium]|nr:hypothetical protein CN918_29790 [Priestia megaterium]